VIPDATSHFAIAESSWHLGASTGSSPVEFEIPMRVGATLHVSGVSANAQDWECGRDVSPMTRWRISGGSAPLDEDVAGKPVFGLTPRGKGFVELGTIAFEDLENTHTISSATLTLYYWNELLSPPQVELAATIGETDDLIALTVTGSATPGTLVQVEYELMRVEEVLQAGLQYRVSRGVEGSTTAVHDAQTGVFELSEKVFVTPFARDFFGSPASGNFSYPVILPDARIACATLFVTNAKGNSETGSACYTGTVDGGLRTLSGGQFAVQVEGHLAIQTDAAPPLIVQDTHSVRDILAVVNEAPAGAPVELALRCGDTPYCTLTIPAGSKYSNVVRGFGLPPLAAGTEINLDIVSVGQTSDSTPGRDLTVTIRL
jgi:hypothetical protein